MVAPLAVGVHLAASPGLSLALATSVGVGRTPRAVRPTPGLPISGR